MISSMKPFPDTENEHALSPPNYLQSHYSHPCSLAPNAPHPPCCTSTRMHRDLRISQRHLTHSHLITPRCNPGAKYLFPPPPSFYFCALPIGDRPEPNPQRSFIQPPSPSKQSAIVWCLPLLIVRWEEIPPLLSLGR